MIRILLIGKSGQLGWEMNRSLATLGELTALDFPEIDLSRPAQACLIVREIRPDIIVNAAAYTGVDQAEVEREKAWQINAIAPSLLAKEAHKLGAFFVHYSTDYVFDGKKGAPYIETDPANPLNYYGASKLEGENLVLASGAAVLVFRTSWVYSLRLQAGFVRKVLQWARQQETLRIVNDQIGNPTWARTLAQTTTQVLSRGKENLRDYVGLYHLAGSGLASRLDWARRILELDPHPSEQVTKELLPALSADFPTPAARPLFSALDCTHFEKTFNLSLPPWQEALLSAMSHEL